jgi:ABC-type uncharacterized transport system permease subunit
MTTGLSFASFLLAALLYATSTVLFYLGVARGTSAPHSSRTMTLSAGLLGLGAAFHAGFVVIASFVARVCPIHSMHFFLSMASLLATTVYLLARRRSKLHALGLLVAPFGLMVCLGTFFLSETPYQRLPASFIALHVLSNLLGEALFLLACGAAVLYLVQEQRIKNKKAPRTGLPPLDVLDKALHRFLVAGFPLLTLGVATGTVWSGRLETGSVDELLRAAFGWAAWVLIAAVLLLRVAAGWRGRRAAYGTIAGFACAITVLVINLVRPMLRAGDTLGG